MNGANSRRAIRLNPIEALILCISVVSVLENSVSHDCDLYTTAESNTSFFFEVSTISLQLSLVYYRLTLKFDLSQSYTCCFHAIFSS